MKDLATTSPRLYRSANDKVIAGVCGGLAQYFRIDPALVRLAFAVFALIGGASIFLYAVLWFAVPVGSSGEPVLAAGGRGNETLAAVLIVVGAVWLLANVGALAFVDWDIAWPFLLIVAGLALLVRRYRS